MAKDKSEVLSTDDEDKKTIKTALDRFKEVADVESKYRKESQEDLRFLSGDQWDPLTKKNREQSGKPVLTIDHLSGFVRQVTNEGRQNRPAIQVNPTGHGGDDDTAEIIAGLIRHIEYDSNADTAYDNAAFYQVAIGEGYFRVISQYEDSDSFDQKLNIAVISNPACVFFDPNSKEPDGSDAEYCFIVDEITQEEYARSYPDSELGKAATSNGWASVVGLGDWQMTDSIRIAEYYYKEWKEETIYHITQNGVDSFTKERPDPKDLSIVVNRTRKSQHPYIKWIKMNGSEILESTDWPGQFIPVVPVRGEEYWVDGKKFKTGIVRSGKDSQKSFNFSRSLQIEMVGLAPKAPFIVATGQLAGREHMWRDANVTDFAYLEYNPIEVHGQLVGAPQRNNMEPAIQAISMVIAGASDDLKVVSGIYDASLGANGNETSGKAILARQKQTSTTNFHYYDNLVRSIKHTGRILVDCIPFFYDTAREIRIVKPTGQQEIVAINQYDQQGKMNDLSVGKYDVIVKTGPSYASRRDEAATAMMDLLAVMPDAAPVISDLMVGEMDWPGADQISKRLKTLVPQAALQADGQDGQDDAAKLQQVTQAATQMGQQLEQLNEHAKIIEQKLQLSDEENKQLKLKSQVELEKAQLDSSIRNRQLDLDAKTTELEFLIKERELALQAQELELKEREMSMNTAKTAHDMSEDIHNRTTLNTPAPTDAGFNKGTIDFE
jgi:hypothetical protein